MGRLEGKKSSPLCELQSCQLAGTGPGNPPDLSGCPAPGLFRLAFTAVPTGTGTPSASLQSNPASSTGPTLFSPQAQHLLPDPATNHRIIT